MEKEIEDMEEDGLTIEEILEKVPERMREHVKKELEKRKKRKVAVAA
ncbi:MAG: hypothetical protein ACXAEU_13840 [Candidatus Hodarchaeales archaeon]